MIALPVALIASSLQTIIAAFAKSFREASTYLSLLVFVPMVPTFWVFLFPGEDAEWMYGVPLLAHSLLMNTLLRGDALEVARIGLAAGTTLLLGVGMMAVAAKLYERERVVFG